MIFNGKHNLRICKVFLLLMACLSLYSCDSVIYDDEGDCEVVYKIRFRYDMNLKWADAFANEVKSINLCAFDQNGVLQWQRTESGEELAREGYAMTVQLLPGKYHLIAWCGLVNDGSRAESFNVPPMTVGVSTQDELIASLNHTLTDEGHRLSNTHLWSLFHGTTDLEVVSDDLADGGEIVKTISLTKDTNHIRVVLQHLSAEDLDVDDFDFKIEADNGMLDHHNNVVPDCKILYSTWATKSGQAGVGKEDSRSVIMVNGAIADLTVNRMMAEHKDEMMLSIYDKKKGTRIAHIPVIHYALLSKDYYEEAYGHKMSDQEFLDREDDYVMTLFLDDDHKWLSSQILIHSWAVVLSNIDLNS